MQALRNCLVLGPGEALQGADAAQPEPKEAGPAGVTPACVC
jgi:hypothetical protein